MNGAAHKSFLKTRKALALLPLLALGAAVFWYVSGYKTEDDSGNEPQPVNFGNTAPAANRVPLPAEEESQALSALDIQGSPKFKGQITGALKLIWMADRETFLFIRKQLSVIRSENKTDFYLDGGLPVAAISNANAFKSMPWCAGIIAHQAFHSYSRLKTAKKPEFTPPPPGTRKVLKVEANPLSRKDITLKSVLAGEQKASKFQVKILIETGASRAEILLVKNRTARDFSTAHDGKYFIIP